MDLGLSWIQWFWFPQRAHLILVTVVLFYASPGPSDSVPHLGLHGPSDLGPHPGIIGTCILYSTTGPHFVQDSGPILVLKLNWLLWFTLWSSPLPGDSGHPLGFTSAW